MAKKTSNPIRTGREQFLKVYAEALREGWSREQCADALGIKPDSVYARVQAEKQKGFKIKPLPVASRKENIEEINALLAEVCSDSAAPSKPPAKKEEAQSVTAEEVAEALDFLE